MSLSLPLSLHEERNELARNELISSSSSTSLYKDTYCTHIERKILNERNLWKILSVSYLKRCFSFAYSRVGFKAYLLMKHWGSSKEGGEFLSWGFLSCELIHHLAYHLSGARFFPIPNFDSYLVG